MQNLKTICWMICSFFLFTEFAYGQKSMVEFVFVKGGTFQMGDTFKDGDRLEKPVHTVTVGDFSLSKYEVTVEQYLAFCKATGRSMPTAPPWGWQDNHPIVNVSWNDATAFCKHFGFRLPTEAEWEYAARDGGKKIRFGNGKNTADTGEINFNGSEQCKESYSMVGMYRQKTTPVGSFPSNGLGLHDMSGNAVEWCSDWYGDYTKSSQTNPQGPAQDSGSPLGFGRVLRGGSLDDKPWFVRCSYRIGYFPDSGIGGFRPARNP